MPHSRHPPQQSRRHQVAPRPHACCHRCAVCMCGQGCPHQHGLHAAGEGVLCAICSGLLNAALLTATPRGFTCHLCDRVYGHSDKLVAHSYEHTGVKPFVCSECPRTFTRQARLREHMRSFHPALLSAMVELPVAQGRAPRRRHAVEDQ